MHKRDPGALSESRWWRPATSGGSLQYPAVPDRRWLRSNSLEIVVRNSRDTRPEIAEGGHLRSAGDDMRREFTALAVFLALASFATGCTPGDGAARQSAGDIASPQETAAAPAAPAEPTAAAAPAAPVEPKATARAQALQAGTYLCTMEQRAGIGSTHLEGAGPPEAFSHAEHYRFRISVSAVRDTSQLRLVEAPYNGSDRSNYEWEDENSTLHSAYIGDGRAFTAEGRPGFMNFARDRWGDALQFYHAGYEYAGGEDESLSVRWGRCRAE
jgi:hypothetical protein